MIVMPDANLDQAADALTEAAFGSAGERCMASSVAVVVGQETADQLITRLKPRMMTLVIGDGADDEADLGPLITARWATGLRSSVDASMPTLGSTWLF